MKQVISVWVCVVFSTGLFGQVGENKLQQPPDSIETVLPTDTIVGIAVEKTFPALQSDSVIIKDMPKKVLSDPIDLAIKQKTDSLARVLPGDSALLPKIKVFKPEPRKAVIYSMIFPGLGQIYNRKYWKLPILYGGFIGFTYAISWNNSHYRDYMGGYIDIVDDDPNTNRWEKFIPYGYTPDTVDKSWLTNALKDRKDYFRYYRDFSIIGTVALYGLAIVDAYVDAQLFDFDISPDLSMRIEPAILNRNGSGFLANAYGVQWSFNF
ncbi:MAG: DUF5683 domain-containing protein [Dysgonamonadaceae bacterium]|jgi:hypothetical protein|nr:DUF5683 domain-containing protein [Dysgonamonadaceae bacterium]